MVTPATCSDCGVHACSSGSYSGVWFRTAIACPLHVPAFLRAAGIALSIAQTVYLELQLREVSHARCGTGLAAIAARGLAWGREHAVEANQMQPRRWDECCMSSSGDITICVIHG